MAALKTILVLLVKIVPIRVLRLLGPLSRNARQFRVRNVLIRLICCVVVNIRVFCIPVSVSVVALIVLLLTINKCAFVAIRSCLSVLYVAAHGMLRSVVRVKSRRAGPSVMLAVGNPMNRVRELLVKNFSLCLAF